MPFAASRRYIIFMPAPPVVLSIAGYDPSSGAGATADIKTAAAFGCYAVTCLTALTVQSTQGVFVVEPVRPELVRGTLARLRQDFEIAAVRIGMLGSGAVASEVADFLERERLPNVVLDPVLRSSSGADLIDAEGLEALRLSLLPLSTLITPNMAEAAALARADQLPSGSSWDSAQPVIRELAEKLHALGARSVLITGGHLDEPVDFLSFSAPEAVSSLTHSNRRNEGGTRDIPAQSKAGGTRPITQAFPGERIESRSTHGTGCALATAIACLLAQGVDLVSAVQQAKEFVRQAILTAQALGKGTGPVNHLFRFQK